MSNEAKKKSWDRWTDVELEELRKYAADGKSVSCIAEELGRGYSSVDNAIRRHKIPIIKKRKCWRKWSDEDLEELRKYVADGKDISWIAKKFDTSYSDVYHTIRCHNIPKMYRELWDDEKVRLLLDMREKGVTYRRIASCLGKTEESVRAKWSRSKKEAAVATEVLNNFLLTKY